VLLPSLTLLAVAGLVTLVLGKLLRASEEPFAAGLAGAGIASLLVIVALTPIVLFLPRSWGWIAAIAIISVVGEAVRVRFAYRAADSINELWDLVSFGLAGAIFGGLLFGLDVAVAPETGPQGFWTVIVVAIAALLGLLQGAAVGALVRARWRWWSTLSCSTAATSAFLLSERLDPLLGWSVCAVTALALLGLAVSASQGRSSSVTTEPPRANTPP
jgi:hypothetical protein